VSSKQFKLRFSEHGRKIMIEASLSLPNTQYQTKGKSAFMSKKNLISRTECNFLAEHPKISQAELLYLEVLD
jgi:hypothetical protein